MLAQVPHAHIRWETILDEWTCGVGEENLPAVPGSADAGGAMDVHADITRVRAEWLPSVETHADAYRSTFRPGMSHYGSLRRGSRHHRVPGARESEEEGIPLGVYLLAAPFLNGGAEEAPVLNQGVCVAVT